MTAFLAAVLRPFLALVLFVAIVAPLSWLLYKIIPNGRLKVFLFKVRTGANASRRDKVIVVLAVIGFYVILFVGIDLYWSQ